MRPFNYSVIKNQKWDSEILGLIAAIYKEAGKQELYLKQRPEELEKLVEIAKIQSTEASNAIEGIVTKMPWLFGVALFVMSILLYSQAATVRAIVPLGIALGMSPMMLIALFPAVNGYFFIPNYPTVVAAINFDRTGTTGIGKYILNHSFMMPGLVATVVALAAGLLLIQIF